MGPPHGKPGPAPRPAGPGGPAVPGAIYGCGQGNGALGAIFYSHYIPLTGHTEIVEPCNFPPSVAFTDPGHVPTSITLCLSNDFGDFALLPGAPVPSYYVWTISQPRCVVLGPGAYTVPGPQYILFRDGAIPPGQWFAIISTPGGQWIPGNTIIVHNGPYM